MQLKTYIEVDKFGKKREKARRAFVDMAHGGVVNLEEKQ